MILYFCGEKREKVKNSLNFMLDNPQKVRKILTIF